MDTVTMKHPARPSRHRMATSVLACALLAACSDEASTPDGGPKGPPGGLVEPDTSHILDATSGSGGGKSDGGSTPFGGSAVGGTGLGGGGGGGESGGAAGMSGGTGGSAPAEVAPSLL